ncbi:uncharacterized protein VTP21DRAFT_11399 [Calcarisporiella thermophila]|uniref:uncharacterized protein n=1 Tax=Calcarisporiella thermophila TaxID=911321 RepID=UPI003743779E
MDLHTSSSHRTAKNKGLSREQHKHFQNILRTLKRHHDAPPFLQPVDPVALQIPDYFSVISHPMDLSTIEKKLSHHKYESVADIESDFRLMFDNCYLYNGKDAPVSIMAKGLEAVFERFMKKVPADPAPANAYPSTPSQPSSYLKPQKVTLSHSSSSNSKRKIDKSEQLKFCNATLRELKKKQYAAISWPFLQPVDPIALNIPDYFNVIKHPMDLSTIEKKLAAKEYAGPEEFEADMRLMFQNCYTYNPADNIVYQAGKQLEEIFNRKWAERPPPPPPSQPVAAPPTGHKVIAHTESTAKKFEEKSRETEKMKQHHLSASSASSESEESDEQISRLEQELRSVSEQLKNLKEQQRKKEKAKEKKTVKRMRGEEEGHEDDFVLTAAEEEELQAKTELLNEDQAIELLKIVDESMPQLKDENGEIEIDLKILDSRTLRRIWNFVMQCTGGSKFRPSSVVSPTKKRRTSKSSASASKSKKTAKKPMRESRRRFEETVQKFAGASSSDDNSYSEESDSDASDKGKPASRSSAPHSSGGKQRLGLGLGMDSVARGPSLFGQSSTQTSSKAGKKPVTLENQDQWAAFVKEAESGTSPPSLSQPPSSTSATDPAWEQFRKELAAKQEAARKMKEQEELQRQQDKLRREEEAKRREEDAKRRAENLRKKEEEIRRLRNEDQERRLKQKDNATDFLQQSMVMWAFEKEFNAARKQLRHPLLEEGNRARAALNLRGSTQN